MAPHRRRNLITSRRRVDDQGEDEEGSLTGDVDDDSLSEGSVISNPEDDADGEGSGTSEDELPSPKGPVKVNGHTNGLAAETKHAEPRKSRSSAKGAFTAATTDTDAMLNGLRIDDHEALHAIDFDEMTADTDKVTLVTGVKSPTPPTSDARPETLGEKRRREHEEYKKKRDTDPAFVPNRGGFFMHDSRSAEPGTNGFRTSNRGRVKGRGGYGGVVSSGRYADQLLTIRTSDTH
jgi:hypothetical protein